ncbi:MAG: hypothetical protein SOU19_06825 [Candidatus Caccosoma sp.]|nr:hypothetical protein [Candidatus Caccosoma sp.]
MILFASAFGYIIVVVAVVAVCLACWFIRKHFKIGTFTKEEESKMKSNLDMLLKEEDKEEGKDYKDEV